MREENLPRFSDYENISKSSVNYLVYTPLVRDLRHSIEKYASGRTLDIGCGNKPYERMFAGKITEYIGCDIIQSDKNKVDIICEANNIPVNDESFDTVFSTQTIEHVADHKGLIKEAYRSLKPSGYFIVSGPLYWPLHEEPYDFFRFTRHGFAHLMSTTGFEVIEIIPNGGMWATTGQSIIHSFMNSRSRNFFVRLVRFMFYRLRLTWMVNSFYGWLDRVDQNPVNTMNYVVVAQKP